MMSGKFNEPRLMGNCENCYYATEKRPTSSCWFEKGTRFTCHRYPTTLDKVRGDYCGEFAWNDMYMYAERLRGEGKP